MKLYLTVLLIFTLQHGFCQQAQPAVVSVTFPDNKSFYATLISNDGNILKAQFYNSGAIYEFNREGKVVTSTGGYKSGTSVAAIRVKKYKADIYSQGYVNNHETIGVAFNDGLCYYGYIEDASSGWFSIRFLHSNSQYTMQFTDGVWKVRSTEKGKYAAGTALTKLFSLETNESFF